MKKKIKSILAVFLCLLGAGCTVTTPVWSLSVDPTAATEVGRQAAEVARDVLSDK
tara:strand:+ start:14213 stop:14377 length:165 start_codon:yes stop_codon:yes gene_type:complete